MELDDNGSASSKETMKLLLETAREIERERERESHRESHEETKARRKPQRNPRRNEEEEIYGATLFQLSTKSKNEWSHLKRQRFEEAKDKKQNKTKRRRFI